MLCILQVGARTLTSPRPLMLDHDAHVLLSHVLSTAETATPPHQLRTPLLSPSTLSPIHTALADAQSRTQQLHSTILTLLSSIVQIVALIWYLVSYFPMGSTGLRFAARFGTSRVTAWMNE